MVAVPVAVAAAVPLAVVAVAAAVAAVAIAVAITADAANLSVLTARGVSHFATPRSFFCSLFLLKNKIMQGLLVYFVN